MLRNPEIQAGAGLQPGALPDAAKARLKFADLPLHPVFFGGLYILVTYQQIYPFCSVAELLRYLIPAIGGISLLLFALHRFCPERIKADILLSLFIVSFCFFGDLRMQLEKLLTGTPWVALVRLRYLLVTIVVVSLVLCWLVIRTPRSLRVLRRYLNVLSAVLILATLLQIFRTPPAPTVAAGPKARVPLHLPPNPPDVYYILTDAYTSPESLKKYWGYDNSPFTDFLTNAGFRIIKNAHGNGDFTPRCLATYLNMDYPPRSATGAVLPARVKYLCNVIAHAEAPERFRASGYKISTFSIFATGGQPRYYYFPIIGSTTFAEFLNIKTVAGYLNTRRTRTRIADVNLDIFSKLAKTAEEQTDRPKFVYAHLMMPHEPFFFDREGNRVDRGMIVGPLKKEDYLDQLIFENTLLTNAVTQILAHSKTPPIIIIQGDHGFRNLPGDDGRNEASTILNALYLPGAKDEWIYDGMTPVNTFRMIFNRYFGEKYEYVPDTQILYLKAEHE